VSVNSPGIYGISLKEEKRDYGGKDLQKRNVLRQEWKSEWGIEIFKQGLDNDTVCEFV